MIRERDKVHRAADVGLPYYFDLQAELGQTKHLGGVTATRELVEMCQIRPGQTLLNVGCGAGVPAAYVADQYDCHVVAVDILPSMVDTAERWALRKGVADRMTFRVADAQSLPFPDNSFDILICESVNTFVPDLALAASEYVRVVKPGGYVGLSEAIWVVEPPPNAVEIMKELTGQHIQFSETWEKMLEQSGLEELNIKTFALTMKGEAKNQSGFLSLFDYLRMFGRFFKIMLRDPEMRSLLKYAGANPREYFDFMGYGLYVGRKPPAA